MKDVDKLNKAPINNLDCERVVGSVNYELGIRGSTELKAASSALVKGKSYDLIELHQADEYKNFKPAVKTINKLVKDWKEKQEELKYTGLNNKEIQSISTDKRRITDLDWLKERGGPFTKLEQVDDYVRRADVTDKEKQKRLYKEVRYARDTSLSLPKSSEMFRLKEKYKPLATDKFATNLKVLFSKVNCNASASWDDFDKAVESLKAVQN